MEFPIEFNECPLCHSKEEPVYRQAWADEPTTKKGSFVSRRKDFAPLKNIADIATLATPTTKMLLYHYDNCAKCGKEYCVRIEKTTMPTEALLAAMGMQVQRVGPRGKMGFGKQR